MNLASHPGSSDGKRRMRQRWELIRVLYLQARIGWIVVGLFWLPLFALTMVGATRTTSDPVKAAGLTFMLTYFGAIVSVMSGALLGVGASHPTLLSLWRRLPGALSLARSSVLLAGCGLWGLAALGGTILALLAGSLSPLSGVLGAASAGLGIGFVLTQSTCHRGARWLKWLATAAITGFAILSGSGLVKPDWTHLWPAFPNLLIPVWPAVWFLYRPDLAAEAPTPQLRFKLLQVFERAFPGPSLPRNSADPRPLLSTRRLNARVEWSSMIGISIFCGWFLRDLPFLVLTAFLVIYVPLFHQSAGAQWFSPRLLSLPGGLVRTRIPDTLFRLCWRERLPVSATYGLLWLASLWLFRSLTAAQALLLLATTASTTMLTTAWSIALLPLAHSVTMWYLPSTLLTMFTTSGILLVAEAIGWHEQLEGLAATLWAVAEFALAYVLAWGVIRISRNRWTRYDLQHLAKLSAEISPAQQYWNSYLKKERS